MINRADDGKRNAERLLFLICSIAIHEIVANLDWNSIRRRCCTEDWFAIKMYISRFTCVCRMISVSNRLKTPEVISIWGIPLQFGYQLMQSGYRWWWSVEKSHFREIIHLISKRDPVSKHPVHSTRSSLRRASSSSRNVSHQNSKRPTLLPLPTQRFIVWCTASETYLPCFETMKGWYNIWMDAKNDLFCLYVNYPAEFIFHAICLRKQLRTFGESSFMLGHFIE